MCCFPSTSTLSSAPLPLLSAPLFCFCFIAVRTLWLNLSADACLGSRVGSTILLFTTLLLPRVYGAYPCSVRPFHSYPCCPHCALRCCITPVSMPGHWGSAPCCCQSWTDRRYPDLAIAVTPIYQTQVSVFVGWSLRVIRPLADLPTPAGAGQAGVLDKFPVSHLHHL